MSKFQPITWDRFFSLPPSGNMMQEGPDGQGVFIRGGNRMSAVVAAAVNVFLPTQDWDSMNILDFGCGNGRVAMPLNFHYGRPNFCCDVDPAVVAHLGRNLPKAEVVVSPFFPPTQFPPDFFDVIYSISIFTHLPGGSQQAWLEEFFRMVKPGGLALISTSGYRELASRRERKMAHWVDVSDQDLEREGMIFHPSAKPPGVSGDYGYAAHSPSWVRDNWSKRFSYLGCWERSIEGYQDLHILMKPK